MAKRAAAGSRDKEAGAYRYQRHQPENILLCQVVERYYPDFTAYLAEQGATAARFVQLSYSFKTHFAAILTDAAGCRSVG